MTTAQRKASSAAGLGSGARSGRGPRGRLALVLAMIMFMVLAAGGTGCGGEAPAPGPRDDVPDVLVTTSHLLDITEAVAGGRLVVKGLLPPGVDPHAFQPTPGAARLVAESPLIILDAYGLAPVVDELIRSSARPGQSVVEAAAGLRGRPVMHNDGDAHHQVDVDPHYWLDPVNVITYVDNIQKVLSRVDPDGAAVYKANAAVYSEELLALDAWIREQVAQIPLERRLLVTNHESFGYFAARYGFTVVGTVFGGGDAGGSPSARELASLIAAIRETGAPAVFLETGSNDSLAAQVAREAGVELVTDLYTHSVGDQAPSYLDMMRWDVDRIVGALR